MSDSDNPRSVAVTRRDLLKYSGLALGGLAIAGSAGPVLAAPPAAPKAMPKVSLETYPDPGWMRITFCGTWYSPRINQACNSVFVELGNDNHDSFVFDCGMGVLSRYVTLGVPYSRMDKVFLTHLHGDHMSDLVAIYCFGPAGDRKSPLYVYGPSGDTKDEGTKAFCDDLYKMCKWHRESFSFLQTGYKKGGDGYDIKAKELPYMKNPGDAYNKDGVKIRHFPVMHARDGAIGYRLEWEVKKHTVRSMVFTGDTKPTNYVIENGQGLDVLIHEMTTTPEVWTTKMLGHPIDPLNEEDMQVLELNTEVIENSHTEWGALGYILSKTNPRLGVGTHFPNDPDLIDDRSVPPPAPWDAYDAVACFWPGSFLVAQDLTVITIDPDGNIQHAFADVCGSCDEYPWPTGAPLKGPLAPSKYDGPLAQFNDTLIENMIDHSVYVACNYPPPL
jgi:ribonuclease Z